MALPSGSNGFFFPDGGDCVKANGRGGWRYFRAVFFPATVSHCKQHSAENDAQNQESGQTSPILPEKSVLEKLWKQHGTGWLLDKEQDGQDFQKSMCEKRC